jgi:DNA-directed RNA polymerase subunit M/transcription elongation factor TFIIS
MEHASSPACTRCGGDRLTWRVKRNRHTGRDSRRELLWTCGGCGLEWTEPLSVGLVPLPGLEPAG